MGDRRIEIKGVVLVGLLVALLCAPVRAQVLGGFDVDAVAVRGDDGGERVRLDLYTRVPYAHLRFLSTGDTFEAEYAVTAELYRPGEREPDRLVERRHWESDVQVEIFSTTRSSRHFDRTSHSLHIEPGTYRLVIRLEDQSSSETFAHEETVVVRPLDGAVAISDLILLDEYDEATSTIAPRVAGLVGTNESTAQFFCELYAGSQSREVQIRREVVRVHQSNVPAPIRTLLSLVRDMDEDGEVVFAETETRRVDANTSRTPLVSTVPVEELAEAGEYILNVEVRNADGRVLDRARERFEVRWTGLEAHVQALDDAVAQLEYIAKGRELRHIREASNQSERLRRFRDFWKKRDPTPSTPRNERMEEYYYRVSFANRAYGLRNDGWKTDRGLVFVKFGRPDRVEQRREQDEPYEIWYYPNIGKRFIFIDRSGGGQYELLVPIWDERNRIR